MIAIFLNNNKKRYSNTEYMGNNAIYEFSNNKVFALILYFLSFFLKNISKKPPSHFKDMNL